MSRAPPLLLCTLVLWAVPQVGCQQRPAAPLLAPPALGDGPQLTAFPCVYFEDLRRYLPKPPEGFRHRHDEGSSGRYGEVAVSEAERLFFTEQGEELSVRIVDTTLSSDLARAIRAAVKDASTREAGDPLSPIFASRTVGFVRYDHDQQLAEANLVVAERFVLSVRAQGVEGTSLVRQVASSIDYDGLALLR